MDSRVHAVPNCGLSRSYVIAGGEGLTVVDVGSVATAEDVIAFIKGQPGMSLEMVRYIAATHFHIDHIGGIGHLLAQCPSGTKVLFHPLVKDYLERKKKISLIRHWFVGFLPATIASSKYIRKINHLNFESLAGIPLPGIRNMVNLPYGRSRISYFCGGRENAPADGGGRGEIAFHGTDGSQAGTSWLNRQPLGFGQWEVIETPGHTEDSVCFFHAPSAELICGDLIVNVGKDGAGRLNRFSWNRNAQRRSFTSLKALVYVKTIYPGHGRIVSGEGNVLERVHSF